MALEDRAALAFQEQGEEAYWDTLATEPRQSKPVLVSRRGGSGYHEPTGNHGNHGVQPVDGILKGWPSS